MARFDIYVTPGGTSAHTPFLIDVQSNHLRGLATRVVVPLRRLDRFPAVVLPPDLTPTFTVAGQACFLDTPAMAAVPTRELGHAIGSAQSRADDIQNALDRLFGGF
ncbi:CcdB family protein [Achromobacter sp. GG226]|uniref:CcdB family protein n=1 Tax=Verticiella alkaliphila TaxID=2779529 RepID=UPI001C0AA295|nr:CcdB family protein [Verticiella sp. GG226]